MTTPTPSVLAEARAALEAQRAEEAKSRAAQVARFRVEALAHARSVLGKEPTTLGLRVLVVDPDAKRVLLADAIVGLEVVKMADFWCLRLVSLDDSSPLSGPIQSLAHLALEWDRING